MWLSFLCLWTGRWQLVTSKSQLLHWIVDSNCVTVRKPMASQELCHPTCQVIVRSGRRCGAWSGGEGWWAHGGMAVRRTGSPRLSADSCTPKTQPPLSTHCVLRPSCHLCPLKPMSVSLDPRFAPSCSCQDTSSLLKMMPQLWSALPDSQNFSYTSYQTHSSP